MDNGHKETVEYCVVFGRSKLKHWIFRFLDEEIQHVYAMRKSEGEQFWIIIDPLNSFTKVDMVLVDEYPHPRCFAGEDAVILPIRTTINTERNRWTPCVFNCVEVVKSLLGIKDFWVFTPYQLFNRLKGAHHV